MKINTFLYAFIIGILGVVTIGALAGQILIATNPETVVDESLSISSARLTDNEINETYTFTLSNLGLVDAGGWVTDSVAITNSSGTTLAGNYTVDYDAQTITFKNNTYMVSEGGAGNDTLVNYQYYPSSYLNQGFARTTFQMVPGFYALMILIAFVAFIYLGLRKVGLGN